LTPEREIGTEDIIINEVQLILAEKRTSLSTMRTGIAVLVLPLSVLSVLIAFSKYYDVMREIHLLVPLLVIVVGLVFLGSYLIIRSIMQIHRHDRLILKLKQQHSRIAEFLD
jgi:uncharacterized membrane protein YidH (DUF202 family)